MSTVGVEALQRLAETDSVLAPLARLQAEALGVNRAAWDAAVPSLSGADLAARTPLLDHVTLAVDTREATDVIARLTTLAAKCVPDAGRAITVASDALRSEPLTAMEASLRQDGARLDLHARRADIEPGLLATLAHLMTLPLLQAVGRRAAPLLAARPWAAGYCPTCAAWPTLVELRGLERQRWLRCGRCGAGWFTHRQVCVYCGNADHKTLGYLAADEDRDARRAETCTRCRGYLKAVATLGALDPSEVLVRDASTIEFDVAALDQEFARPPTPAYSLQVSVQPATKENRWSVENR